MAFAWLSMAPLRGFHKKKTEAMAAAGSGQIQVVEKP